VQLYLIPPDSGQGGRVPTRRRLCVTRSLSDIERKRLRAALKNLRAAYGTWACLAEVMGMPTRSIRAIASGQFAGSPGTAMRAARAAGTTIERLLGRPVAADRCPHCGRGAP
jgi:hypothetical protein